MSYIPNFNLYGEPGFTCPWVHGEDDANGIPLESGEGYTFDTGRGLAYRHVTVPHLDPGEVLGSLFADHLTRVKKWQVRTSVFKTGGELPSLIVFPGQSDIYPGSVTFEFRTHGAGRGAETWSGLTITSDRSGYEDHYGRMPCGDRLAPVADMDLTISGTSVLDFSMSSGSFPSAGPITCNFSFRLLFSQLIGYLYTPTGGSYVGYEVKMEWHWGPDDAGGFGAGGYSSLYPGPAPNLIQGTDILSATLVTNQPEFGSADDSSQSVFDSYVYNLISSLAPPYSQPTTQVDNGSFPGGFQLPIEPISYFGYADPLTGINTFDPATGRLLISGLMPMVPPSL